MTPDHAEAQAALRPLPAKAQAAFDKLPHSERRALIKRHLASQRRKASPLGRRGVHDAPTLYRLALGTVRRLARLKAAGEPIPAYRHPQQRRLAREARNARC